MVVAAGSWPSSWWRPPVVFLWFMYAFYHPESFLDPDLPALFYRGFWVWVLVFILGIIASIVYLVRTLRAARPATRADATTTDLAGRFPEIDAAWEEIQHPPGPGAGSTWPRSTSS